MGKIITKETDLRELIDCHHCGDASVVKVGEKKIPVCMPCLQEHEEYHDEETEILSKKLFFKFDKWLEQEAEKTLEKPITHFSEPITEEELEKLLDAQEEKIYKIVSYGGGGGITDERTYKNTYYVKGYEGISSFMENQFSPEIAEYLVSVELVKSIPDKKS